MAEVSASRQAILIGYMQREPVFIVLDLTTGKEYRFTYDMEDVSMFFINQENKRFKVTNTLAVLYGIAKQTKDLEVYLQTKGDKNQQKMLFIDCPELLLV